VLPPGALDFWESLFELVEQGTTILVSTHFMDEAERCHHLAILNQGRKVADDSPKNLMRDIDAHVVEVNTDAVAQARQALQDLEQIKGVTQLGLSLRVLVDKHIEQAEEFVRQSLTGRQLSAAVTLIEPNLEDVFVVATMGQLPGHKS
jgi:ABC-2 type transport system ATP-binding protein